MEEKSSKLNTEETTNINNSSSVPAAKAKKHHRKKSRKVYVLYFAILLLFICATIYFVITMLFNVDTVIVYGNTIYENSDIIKTSKIEKGQNLFDINTAKCEEDIYLSYSYVEKVEVERNYPNNISIYITEAIPFACVEESDGYTLLSQGGKVLERGLDEAPKNTMVARGFSTITSTDDDKKRFSLLKEIMEHVDELSMKKCNIINLSDTLDISIIYDERIRISLGNELELEYKLQFANNVIKEKLPDTGYYLLDASTPGQVMTKELTMSPSETLEKYTGTGLNDETEE